MQNSAQQLNKSFICNVPLPHLSSFRCKRSNNFLNKRKQKSIYKIPIQLIINGLSKTPLCIWTTAVSVGKGHTASTSAISRFWKIKLRKRKFLCNYHYYYIFTERSWNKFPLKVEKAFGSFLCCFFIFIFLLYIFHQVNFCRFQVLTVIGSLSVLYDSSGLSKEEVKMKSQSVWFTTGDGRGWLRGSIKITP